METIKMKITKKEAGVEIAEIIRWHFEGPTESGEMPVVIGIMPNGTIDSNYSHECGEWPIAIYDTADGGASIGVDCDIDMTDEDETELAEVFEKHWINDKIAEAVEFDWNLKIEWPTEDKETT